MEKRKGWDSQRASDLAPSLLWTQGVLKSSKDLDNQFVTEFIKNAWGTAAVLARGSNGYDEPENMQLS
jgi:hypothetical protein